MLASPQQTTPNYWQLRRHFAAECGAKGRFGHRALVDAREEHVAGIWLRQSCD